MNSLILLLTGAPECGWFIGITAVILLLLGRYAIATLALGIVLGIKPSIAGVIFWGIIMIICFLICIFT
jgi:hypothetical protein